MIQEMLAMSVGGSSESAVKSGVETITLTVDQTFEVDTGLSQITRFSGFYYPTTTNPGGIIVDTENRPNKYIAFGGSYYFPDGNIGSSIHATYCYTVVSINGGKITLKTTNNTTYMATDLYWFAE